MKWLKMAIKKKGRDRNMTPKVMMDVWRQTFVGLLKVLGLCGYEVSGDTVGPEVRAAVETLCNNEVVSPWQANMLIGFMRAVSEHKSLLMGVRGFLYSHETDFFRSTDGLAADGEFGSKAKDALKAFVAMIVATK